MGKLTIIQGATGSGKSLRARSISQATGARIYDEIGYEDTVIVIAPGVEVEIITTNYEENN